MKKVLLTLLAVLTAIPAFAIQVYNEGDTNVDIYGTIRGYVGYGYGANAVNGTAGAENNDFLYGLQGNSRLGVKFAVGAFSGQVEIGANEKTLYNNPGDGLGFRQAWGAYSFGNAGKLLVGKTDTPTSMSGFSADIFDTDGGLAGFGGTSTSNRRFQVQYSIAGFTIALIEDDSVIGKDVTYDDGTTWSANFKDGGAVIPRLGLSYTYNQNNLMAKVGITYTGLNGTSTVLDANNVATQEWKTIHVLSAVAGVKPTFLDGKMWLSVQAGYDMNGDLIGERKSVVNNGGFKHTAIDGSLTASVGDDGTVYNVSRFNVMAELGYKVMDNFSVILGGGYQMTMADVLNLNGSSTDIHSYSVYVQAPYAVNKNLSFIPQVGWYETMGITSYEGNSSDAKQTGVLAGMQMRVTF